MNKYYLRNEGRTFSPVLPLAWESIYGDRAHSDKWSHGGQQPSINVECLWKSTTHYKHRGPHSSWRPDMNVECLLSSFHLVGLHRWLSILSNNNIKISIKQFYLMSLRFLLHLPFLLPISNLWTSHSNIWLPPLSSLNIPLASPHKSPFIKILNCFSLYPEFANQSASWLPSIQNWDL